MKTPFIRTDKQVYNDLVIELDKIAKEYNLVLAASSDSFKEGVSLQSFTPPTQGSNSNPFQVSDNYGERIYFLDKPKGKSSRFSNPLFAISNDFSKSKEKYLETLSTFRDTIIEGVKTSRVVFPEREMGVKKRARGYVPHSHKSYQFNNVFIFSIPGNKDSSTIFTMVRDEKVTGIAHHFSEKENRTYIVSPVTVEEGQKFYSTNIGKKADYYTLKKPSENLRETLSVEEYEKLLPSYAQLYSEHKVDAPVETVVFTAGDNTIWVHRDFDGNFSREATQFGKLLAGQEVSPLIMQLPIFVMAEKILYEVGLRINSYGENDIRANISKIYDYGSSGLEAPKAGSVTVNFHSEPWVKRSEQVPQRKKNGGVYADGRKTTVTVPPKVNSSVDLYTADTINDSYVGYSAIAIKDLFLPLHEIEQYVDELFNEVTFHHFSGKDS